MDDSVIKLLSAERARRQSEFTERIHNVEFGLAIKADDTLFAGSTFVNWKKWIYTGALWAVVFSSLAVLKQSITQSVRGPIENQLRTSLERARKLEYLSKTRIDGILSEANRLQMTLNQLDISKSSPIASTSGEFQNSIARIQNSLDAYIKLSKSHNEHETDVSKQTLMQLHNDIAEAMRSAKGIDAQLTTTASQISESFSTATDHLLKLAHETANDPSNLPSENN